jgi:WD40 repeat protein
MKTAKPQLFLLWGADIGEHVIALAWAACADAPLLAAAAVGGPITIFGLDGHVAGRLPGHGFGTTALTWRPPFPPNIGGPEGATLASAGQDGKVRLWDVARGVEVAALDGGAAWVERLAWSPDGAWLATAAGRKLRLWGPDGVLVREYPTHASTIADIAWVAPAFITAELRPTQPVLVTAAYGGITLWSPAQAGPLARFEWKGSSLVLAPSPDGRYIATGDQDASVHFWIVAEGQDLQMSGYPTKVRELSWDPTARYLATGGSSSVTVWDCGGAGPEGTRPKVLDWHEDYVSAVAFQRQGAAQALLASGGLDARLALWRAEKSRKAPLAMAEMSAPVSQLAWSPDDSCLAAGDAAGQVQLYGVGG